MNIDTALARLYVLNEALAEATTRQAVGAAVLAHASLFQARAGYFYFVEPNHMLLGPSWGITPAMRERWAVLPIDSDNLITRVGSLGAPHVVAGEHLFDDFPELRNNLEVPENVVYVSLPLGADDQILGILALRVLAERATEDHIDFVNRCALDIGRALGRAALHERVVRSAEVEQRVLATLSHDLRTPLGAIGMTAELLKRQPDTPDAPAHLDRILASVDRARRMIDSLLAYSRARQHTDRNRMPLVSLTSIITGQVDELRLLFPDRAIELHLPVDEVLLHVERTSIEQILSNLVRNAVQHGDPQGAVTVVLQRTATIMLTVHNLGEVIPADVIDRLFEPFHTERETGGVGLGLYIVRELTERLSGEITVQSDQLGTVFRVSLPPD